MVMFRDRKTWLGLGMQYLVRKTTFALVKNIDTECHVLFWQLDCVRQGQGQPKTPLPSCSR